MHHRAAGVLHQIAQEVELLRRQVDGNAEFPQHPAGQVQFQCADAEQRIRLGLRRARAPDRRAYAGRQFEKMEGFGDVIIRAGVQRCDLIFFAITHGQHQDADLREVLPDLAASTHSTHSRHVDVEQQDIVAPCRKQLKRGFTAWGYVREEAEPLQRQLHGASQRAVILHDQDSSQ